MTLARIQDTLEVPDDGPEEAAAAAGLHYVVDAQPGIARRRRGRGFSYHDVGGATISDENTLGRIRSLAIPPAWTDVWICADPKGHLQATGRDVKGRKQYRYHPRWREVRDANKFAALSNFGAVLPDVRERLDVDLRRPGLPREKVLAVVVGHVLGVIAAHDRAVAVLPPRHQITGQLPMLFAMIAFTTGGLYLLFAA